MTIATEKPRQFPCQRCGAMLQFEPGESCLKCPYCQTENTIARAVEPVEELDFHAALADRSAADATHEILTVHCNACGAESTLAPNITAGRCPFCASPIVAESVSTRHIKPRALLPFKLKQP